MKDILKKNKFQKYLILVSITLIASVVISFKSGLLEEKLAIKPEVSLPAEHFPEININFQVLEDQSIKEFDSFPELPSYPDQSKIGKENPFSR